MACIGNVASWVPLYMWWRWWWRAGEELEGGDGSCEMGETVRECIYGQRRGQLSGITRTDLSG